MQPKPTPAGAEQPLPPPVRTYDDLAAALQELRVRAGVSYRELHRRVLRRRRQRRVPELPAYDTVYRCLQPGRTRVDADLVEDIARVLGASDPRSWLEACRALGRRGEPRVVVDVGGLPARQQFVGRRAQLAALAAATSPDARHAVCLVTGMAGVGKTSLVVEAAHRFATDRHPDRVCFVDLRGFDPTRPPVEWTAVLEPLLRGLGLPPARIALADLGRRTELLHRTLHTRRVLVVLDNVRDAEQVRPLLPATAGAARMLITSRSRLDLGRDAATVELDVFTPTESVALLSAAGLPVDDPAGELAELAELAGHLPLALSLLSSRIAARRDWSLADHVDQLRALHAARRLDVGVEASLRLSYADLAQDERRILRLLSQLPGSAFDAHLVAAVGEVHVSTARGLLDELARANLVRPTADDRYGFHDVVRMFLGARSLEEDPPRVRSAAIDRMYDYHRAATAAARRHYAPQLQEVPAPDRAPDVPCFAGRTDATRWLERERADLLAGAFFALDHGRVDHAVRMSGLLFTFLVLTCYADDGDRLYRRIADATCGAERADALLGLGAVNGAAGRLARVRAPLEEALELYEELGDRTGVAKAVHNLGTLCWTLGDYPAATGYYERALDLAPQVEGPSGVAMTVDNIGLLHARQGRYAEARECHGLALDIHRRLDDRIKEGRTLGHLGSLAGMEGHADEAADLLTGSLVISREVADAVGELCALSRLAELDSLAGRHEQAIRRQRQAAAIARGRETSGETMEVLVGLAAACRRAGRFAIAEHAQTEALTAARESGDPYWTARALTEGMLLAGSRGDDRTAEECRRTATELYERLGVPVPKIP
jgi:tetratricopeptide (TPR) repeat protein